MRSLHRHVAEAARAVVDRVRARVRLDVPGALDPGRVVDVVGVLVADQHQLGVVLLEQPGVLVVGGRRAERDVHRHVHQHDHALALRVGLEVVLDPLALLVEWRRPVVLEHEEVPLAVVERVPLRPDVAPVVVDPGLVGRRAAVEVLVVADRRPDRQRGGGRPGLVLQELRVRRVVGEVARDLDEGELLRGLGDLAHLLRHVRVAMRVGDVGEREVVAAAARVGEQGEVGAGLRAVRELPQVAVEPRGLVLVGRHGIARRLGDEHQVGDPPCRRPPRVGTALRSRSRPSPCRRRR